MDSTIVDAIHGHLTKERWLAEKIARLMIPAEVEMIRDGIESDRERHGAVTAIGHMLNSLASRKQLSERGN